jgi:hypothetical protein
MTLLILSFVWLLRQYQYKTEEYTDYIILEGYNFAPVKKENPG